MNVTMGQGYLLRARHVQVPRVVVLVLCGALLMSLGAFLPIAALRVVLVMPLALFLPGFAMIVALFGVRPRLDVVVLAALSTLLSMAIYPLVGLALYYAAVRLSTISVVTAMDVVLLLLLGVTVVRANSGWLGDGPYPTIREARARPSVWQGSRGVLLFAAIVAVVGASVLVAAQFLPQAKKDTFTQFYLSGQWSHDQSTASLAPGRRQTVTVGITNQTRQRHVYRLLPTLDGSPSWIGSSVTLSPGRSWTGAVSGFVPASGCVHRLSIQLVQDGTQLPLDDLVVWLQGSRVLPSSCTRASGR